MRRLLAALVTLSALVLAVPARGADDLTAMTNAERTSRGLRPLAAAADLGSFAQRRAEEMARAGRLWHTPNLGEQISNWRRLGENVGRGRSLPDIQQGFMGSEAHRANILQPDFSQIGVGVASGGDQKLYVAVIFRQPSSATAASAPPPPAPAPTTTAPPPRPKPAPAPPPPAPVTTTTLPAPAPAPPAVPAEPAPAPAPDPALAPPAPAQVQGESMERARAHLEPILEATAPEAATPEAALPVPSSTSPSEDEPVPAATVAIAVLALGGAWTSVLAKLRRGRRLSSKGDRGDTLSDYWKN